VPWRPLSSPGPVLMSGGSRCGGGRVQRCTRWWWATRWIAGPVSSCRHPGAVLGRVRRRCQVRVAACFWLHQPETLLLDLLAYELDQHPEPSAGAGEQVERSGSGQRAPAADLETTDVLPRIDRDQDDPPPQTPAVPRPPLPGSGCPPAGQSAQGTAGPACTGFTVALRMIHRLRLGGTTVSTRSTASEKSDSCPIRAAGRSLLRGRYPGGDRSGPGARERSGESQESGRSIRARGSDGVAAFAWWCA